MLVKVGTGFTGTTTLYEEAPEQPFADTVYTYVTLTAAAVVFVSVSIGSPVPELAGLLIPATAALVQLNVAPEVELVGE